MAFHRRTRRRWSVRAWRLPRWRCRAAVRAPAPGNRVTFSANYCRYRPEPLVTPRTCTRRRCALFAHDSAHAAFAVLVERARSLAMVWKRPAPCTGVGLEDRNRSRAMAVAQALRITHSFVFGQFSRPKRMSWCPFETPFGVEPFDFEDVIASFGPTRPRMAGHLKFIHLCTYVDIAFNDGRLRLRVLKRIRQMPYTTAARVGNIDRPGVRGVPRRQRDNSDEHPSGRARQ
jgi:hypothetical protein